MYLLREWLQLMEDKRNAMNEQIEGPTSDCNIDSCTLRRFLSAAYEISDPLIFIGRGVQTFAG